MKFADSDSAPTSSHFKKWLIPLLIVTVLIVSIPYLSPPPPDISIPKDLESLEPQLKAYIEERVTWVAKAQKEGHRHATLGTIYAVNGLWNEALVQFENATILDPDQPLAFLYRAVALQETGELTKSVEQYKHLCRRFSSFPQGFARLGQAQLKIGATKEAQKAFERLILLAPNEWRGYTGLGDSLLRQGLSDEALPHLNKALSIDPNIGIARHLRGLAYQRTGKSEEAERELAAGAGAVYYPMPDPWSATAPQHFRRLQDQFSVANDYMDAGRPQQALPILLQAQQWHPDNQSLLTNLARAHAALGNLPEAKETLSHLLNLDPDNLSALVIATDVELDLGNPSQAEQYANTAVNNHPDAPPGHLALATVLLNTDRLEAGVQSYKNAFDRDPQNPLIAMELGDVLMRLLDRPTEALIYYLKASEIDPNLFLVQIRIVDVYLRQSKSNEAATALNKARQLSPTDPVIQVLQQRLDSLSPSLAQ
ncbi:tetratricopeptide repeat protein [Verrucomicrobia bacterium]|jgi:tetratricopeptide (TPR) repeat protein|nr:tetratricopeptide repeat protein [Verrucomicrobiota bacterium]